VPVARATRPARRTLGRTRSARSAEPDRCRHDVDDAGEQRAVVGLGLAAGERVTALKAALPGITPLGSNTFSAPISGVCNLPQFNGGDFTQFLPLNCQLIDPLKLHEPIITTVSWLGNLDLARIDHVFSVQIPGLGFALSAIAVVAALLQFVQVRMTSPRPNRDDPTSSTTNTMTYLFPLLTIWWGGLFPSGLILYWVVYTAYLVVQQYRIMGWGNLFPLFGWMPGFAPRPETALISGPPRREPAAADNPGKGSAQPSNPRPVSSSGGGNRPGSRQGGKKKRRGRKR